MTKNLSNRIMNHISVNDHNNKVIWKIDELVPDELAVHGPSPTLSQPVLNTLIPRTVAWFAIDDGGRVALLDGYTASCYTPPAIHFAASALPKDMIDKLEQTKVCSLSAATVRESNDILCKAQCRKGHEQPESYMVDELGLHFSKFDEHYPPTLVQSPIKMFCSLYSIERFDKDEAMVVLVVERFVVDGSVLSAPTESMIKRNITAKIDAELIKPVSSLGVGDFAPMTSIRSMPRPIYNEKLQKWTSTELESVPKPARSLQKEVFSHADVEWKFRIHGEKCPLGFNPTLALIMPRPIGWISTYTKTTRLKHLAPYSFFIDVARGMKPKVAFSAYRIGGARLKDAQKNAEETGFFCFNMVTEDLAVQMNYSAAELGREESEFELSNLEFIPARTVDAPLVKAAKITYECVYLKTVDIESFSIVIGEVISIAVDKRIVKDKKIERHKLRPIARLGYTDEYGLF